MADRSSSTAMNTHLKMSHQGELLEEEKKTNEWMMDEWIKCLKFVVKTNQVIKKIIFWLIKRKMVSEDLRPVNKRLPYVLTI